jgi:hypothetical protein
MSSIIFRTEENQVCVATDTLATSNNGTPRYFTNKAQILPHLKMIVAGTGAAGFMDRWIAGINNIPVRGIDHLDYLATAHLPDAWGGFKLQISIPDNLTTTIYHFGFSEVTGVIHAYAYRSDNGFRSERLEYGNGVKPDCTIPKNFEFPTVIKEMMEEQRDIQAKQPDGQRLYIGGEIQIHHLTRNGFNVYQLAEFEDYDSMKETVYQNR